MIIKRNIFCKILCNIIYRKVGILFFILLYYLVYMVKNLKVVCFGVNMMFRLCSVFSEEVWKCGDIILMFFNRDLFSRMLVSFL